MQYHVYKLLNNIILVFKNVIIRIAIWLRWGDPERNGKTGKSPMKRELYRQNYGLV